jgi:hypothetical protein
VGDKYLSQVRYALGRRRLVTRSIFGHKFYSIIQGNEEILLFQSHMNSCRHCTMIYMGTPSRHQRYLMAGRPTYWMSCPAGTELALSGGDDPFTHELFITSKLWTWDRSTKTGSEGKEAQTDRIEARSTHSEFNILNYSPLSVHHLFPSLLYFHQQAINPQPSDPCYQFLTGRKPWVPE